LWWHPNGTRKLKEITKTQNIIENKQRQRMQLLQKNIENKYKEEEIIMKSRIRHVALNMCVTRKLLLINLRGLKP